MNRIMTLLFLLGAVSCSSSERKHDSLEQRVRKYLYAYNYNQQQFGNCKDKKSVLESCLILQEVRADGHTAYYDFSFSNCNTEDEIIPCNSIFTGFGVNSKGVPIKLIKHHSVILDFDYDEFEMDDLVRNLTEDIKSGKESVSWLKKEFR